MKKNYIIVCLLLLISILSGNKLYAFNQSVLLKVFPSDYTLTVDNKQIKPIKITQFLKKIYIKPGMRKIIFSAKGYDDKKLEININHNTQIFEVKLEKTISSLKHIKTLKTGWQPKSVEFSPDGKYFVTALLKDEGVDVFTMDGLTKIKRIQFPTKYAKKAMFVEIIFVPEKNEMWISQMSTGSIHIVNMKDFTYKSTFKTKGIWTKVMAFSVDRKLFFASNWISKDISIMNTNTHKLIKKIKVSGIPRGMVATNDGKYLYVCIFDNGQIQKIDLEKMKVIKTLFFPKGAKRHVVMDKNKNLLYVTDMLRGSIYVISTINDSTIKEINVDQKLNTCKLTPDKKYLFVSSRGPNNKESYHKKGPKFGKIFVIETKTLKIKEWIWGKNQPTGLDISSDGKHLAFTNFLDNEVEIYQLNFQD